MLPEPLKKREMAYQDAGGLGASQEGATTLAGRDWLSVLEQSQVSVPGRESFMAQEGPGRRQAG